MIGDHIRARRDGRWVHGIDCGDRTVMFLAEDPALAPADRLRRRYRPEFEAGADAVETVTHRVRVFPPRQVVARAFSRTRDPALAVMFGDSRAFAEWCKTGRVLPDPGAPLALAPLAIDAAATAPRRQRTGGARRADRAAREPVTAPPRKAAAKARPVAKAAAKARPGAKAAPKARPAAKGAPKARPAAKKAATKAAPPRGGKATSLRRGAAAAATGRRRAKAPAARRKAARGRR